MPKAKHVSVRAAQGAQLRSAKRKAMRWANRLQKAGFTEEARQLRETAGQISAGRGRSYGEAAKSAAKQVEETVASQKSLHESMMRFRREEASFRRGMGSPLSQGVGLSNLMTYKKRSVTVQQRHVAESGRYTVSTEVVDIRRESMRERARLMGDYFYSQNKRAGMYSGDALEAYGMEHGNKSGVAAWRAFWNEAGEHRHFIEVLDKITVAAAEGRPMDDELLDLFKDLEDMLDSPRAAGYLESLFDTWSTKNTRI